MKPLADAEKAFCLIGSSLPGVMTRRSKVAYSTQEAVDASKAAIGGEIVDFDKALPAAYTMTCVFREVLESRLLGDAFAISVLDAQFVSVSAIRVPVVGCRIFPSVAKHLRVVLFSREGNGEWR